MKKEEGPKNKDFYKKIAYSFLIVLAIIIVFGFVNFVFTGKVIDETTLRGDFNQDNQIDINDALLILDNSNNQDLSQEEIYRGDVDLDLKVTKTDAEIVLKYVADILPVLPIKFGDLNQDLEITATEALMISSYVEGNLDLTSVQKFLADVNRDGKINSRDSELTLQASLGSVTLPVFEEEKEIVGDLNQDGKISKEDASILFEIISTKNSYSEEELFYGDVDRDGKLTLQGDVEMLVRTNYFSSFPTLYGDLNQDNKISASDALLVQSYLNGSTSFSLSQKFLADVNKDQEISNEDSILIIEATLNNSFKLPKITGTNIDVSSGQIFVGDVNNDGKISATDALLVFSNLEKEISEEERKRSDADNDGTITATDAHIILKKAIEDFFYNLPIRFGDLNQDRQITATEALMISSYVEGNLDLTSVQKFLADVNRDGKIDSRDSELTLQASLGSVTLPVIEGDIDSKYLTKEEDDPNDDDSNSDDDDNESRRNKGGSGGFFPDPNQEDEQIEGDEEKEEKRTISLANNPIINEKTKDWIWIVIFLLVVAIIGIISLIIYLNKKKKQKRITRNNKIPYRPRKRV